jgi:4-hydroxybenzoate polyprenyltransferase
VLAWFTVLALTTVFALLAAHAVGATIIVAAILGLVFLVALVEGSRFLAAKRPNQGKRLETLAGIWTIAMYLGVGVGPLFF